MDAIKVPRPPRLVPMMRACVSAVNPDSSRAAGTLLVKVAFRCDCSKERVAKALASLSKKDLDDLIKDEEPIEVKCHFCNENYVFSPDDLREIRK